MQLASGLFIYAMQDERVKLRTEIDTDEASASLESLKSELRDVKRELKEMGQVSEEWSDEQKQAYTELKQRQNELTAEVKEYTRNIDLNDASMNELRARMRQLVSEQNALTAGTDEWIEKTRQVNQVKERIEDVREEANQLGRAMDDQHSIFARWKDDFIGTFAAIQLDDIVDEVVDFGRESVESAAKTSDAFADVQKSTGMTTDEVKGLNEELKNIDTRSAQEALLDIAKVGGQLGIAEDEIKGFTESVDKANVALGDEFSGGAEQVATEMGTLAKLFKETKDLEAGKAINDIGSAINELGAAGSATGPVVADFTTRIGQLGDLAPEISQTMGLGAAFQELGLTAEIAAGGITNILLTASKSTADFAKQLGISEVEMKKLINTNPNEFLLRLAESLRGLPADQVAKRLDDLGIKSQEATKVMSLLKDQTDLVRDRQQLANKAMQEGTSLTNEFNIKNNTAAAELDKGKKALENFKTELGAGLIPFVLAGTQGLIAFLRVLTSIPGFVQENKMAIGLLAVGLLTLNANLIRAQVSSLALAAQQKLQAIASAVATAAENARAQAAARAAAADTAATTASERLTVQERLAGIQTTASNLLTQAKIVLTNAWTVAQNALNVALRNNPIGIVVTVLAVLAAGLVTAYQKSETFRGIVNGVWAALKVGWQAITDLSKAFTDFVGDALEPVIQYLSPVRTAFQSLWNVLRAGLSYWIDLQKAVFEFAVDAIGGLLNRIAPVKTALQGLWNSILSGIQTIKNAANAVAEFLHIDGLVARAKQTGQQMGQAFKDTYHKEIDAARAKDASDDQEHNARKTANAKTSATTSADALKTANAGALSSMSTDNESHRKSEQDKAAAHAKKLAEDKKKANADALEDIKKAQIDLMQDEQQRKLAQLAFERDQDKARINESVADNKLKAQQKDLIEKQYEQDVAKVQKDYRDKKAKAEADAMAKYLADKEAQAERERSLFSELENYEKQTRQTNAQLDLQLTTLTESQKLKLKQEQAQQALADAQAKILAEYTAKVNEITANIRDNDQRMQAIKTLNEWKNSQLAAADKAHATDMTALNKEHLEKRQANQKEFFDGLNGLMKGDYTSFMGFLEKKLANDKAANQKGLQDFTAKGQSTLGVAAQVVGSLQQLNQKYLDSQLAKITKEKDRQIASWQEQYSKGKISKEQFEKEVDRINKDAAEKEKQEKLKAWKRDQAMQIAMALINGAQAALKSLATLGWPLGLIAVAAAAVTAGIQIAMIKRQQPPSFATGGFVANGGVPDGPAHGGNPGEGGISLINNKTGQHLGEMEGGEPIMILSKNTYKNNRPVIDKLLHSSLHRKGAPIFARGGAFGSDGGSYDTYLKPLQPGGWYEDGTDVSDSGGSSDSGGGGDSSSGGMSADDFNSETDAQIKKSQETMDKIAKNTGDTSENLKALVMYLQNTFLWQIQSMNTATRDQILTGLTGVNTTLQTQFQQLTATMNRNQVATAIASQQRHTFLLAEMQRQVGILKTSIDNQRSSQNLQLMFIELATQGRHRELLSQLDKSATNALMNDQELARTLLTEIQNNHSADTLSNSLHHLALVTEIRKQFSDLIRNDTKLNTDLLKELDHEQRAAALAEQLRHLALLTELRKQFSDLIRNDDLRSKALLNEMDTEQVVDTLASNQRHKALMDELRKQFTAIMKADDQRGSLLLKTIGADLEELIEENAQQNAALMTEMKRQGNALTGETRKQTDSLWNVVQQQTNVLHGDNGWQSELLQRIANKDLSVSIHNVVNVAAQKTAVDSSSNLR